MNDLPNLPNICEAFRSTPWAILPAKLEEIRAVLLLRLRGERLSPEDIEAARRTPPDPAPRGKVAVLSVFGTISQRPSFFSSGGTSTEAMGKQLDAAVADRDIRAIVLNVDSPGGSVFGVPELAARIRDARDQKKIVAVANSLAASAAYWLASQASEVVVTPSGQVGSIGVLAAHEQILNDVEKAGTKVTVVSAGKFKAEASPFEPLADDARAALQAEVDRYYGLFVGDVAKGRGRQRETVRNGFGEGRVVGAEQAVALGMADRVGTLEDTLRRLGASAAPSGTSAMARRAAEVALAEAER